MHPEKLCHRGQIKYREAPSLAFEPDTGAASLNEWPLGSYLAVVVLLGAEQHRRPGQVLTPSSRICKEPFEVTQLVSADVEEPIQGGSYLSLQQWILVGITLTQAAPSEGSDLAAGLPICHESNSAGAKISIRAQYGKLPSI